MKKPTPKSLKVKLWNLCKTIVRGRYVNKDGSYKCYTCDRRIEYPCDAHTAHFIPSGACGAFLRYDLRNIRICCYNCNVNLGGNGVEFYPRMVREKGQEYVDQLFRDKQKIIKCDVIWLQSKINEYESLISNLYEK